MERVLVRGCYQELYNEILTDFCIGDYQDVKRYEIDFREETDDPKEKMVTICALEYMKRFTKEEGNHRVHSIKEK